MRYNVLKTNSSKAERIVFEILKEIKIPFRHRWMIDNHEIDFVIGNYAIEINGHEQDISRNEMIIKNGYIPIHFNNKYILDNRSELKTKITKLIYG
jgi:very-short-patch-repair endonuclease